MAASSMIAHAIIGAARVLALLGACYLAYDLRIIAIQEYGRLIHEFDPWFNYRATEYLHAHGRAKFFTWFDHMSWYPLGRPVGTTIYPGMQFTSVGIFHALKALGMPMSLNDVCCFVPAWFGVSASLLVGMISYECQGSMSAAAASALVMSIIPAHMMRSIGGGYDNESIAVTAMCLTFYLWCRSLRSDGSWTWGAAAGVAYFYMVAAWGGYVFVLNMVAAHAGLLMLIGRFSPKLYKSYSLFYVVGTLMAIQLPVVGWTPLKSMEQFVPLALFLTFQLRQLGEIMIQRRGLDQQDANLMRVKLLMGAVVVAAGAVAALAPIGVLGPVSMRVRSLFIKHTRTGNPLVDSVAEHQATSPHAYWQYLHYGCLMAPIGFVICAVSGRKGDGKLFLLLYALVAYYFANKMNRLIILMGPVVSSLSGIALGVGFDWCVHALLAGFQAMAGGQEDEEGKAPEPAATATKGKERSKGGKKMPKGASSMDESIPILFGIKEKLKTRSGKKVMAVLALLLIALAPSRLGDFYMWSTMFAVRISHPKVVYKGQLDHGEVVTVTDYLDSYTWLKENTPEDARILSWWDYGYQITGIGNRTTLADGNTWNQAHIALIGKMLTSPQQKAHNMIKHVADYVYVWSGGGGDDLAKSPHLARIATSNFPKHCGVDRSCAHFGFHDKERTKPTPMMEKSLLYRLTSNGAYHGVTIDNNLWEEVYTSKYMKVRIYKVKGVDMESRAWLADPANRLCDRPGSWYCPGQYPPALWSKLPSHFLKGHRMNQTNIVRDEAIEIDEEKM